MFGMLRQKRFMKTVRQTVAYASLIITICDKMSEDYSNFFCKECCSIYTPVEKRDLVSCEGRKKIAYFGNLGLQRDDQLVNIGRSVKKTANITGIDHIDVYTAEKRQEALSKMTIENGIVLHSAVSFDAMLDIYKDCIALIHTESFDNKIRKRVKYSISTKIPEALAFGPCLLAYGPSEIASIEYLEKNKAAFIVHETVQLENEIVELVRNDAKRENIIKQARLVAELNHNIEKNYDMMNACFMESVKVFHVK